MSKEMKAKYCANCDNVAVSAVLRDDSDTYPLPLCFDCATAYEWGQASPDRPIVDIDGVDREDWLKGDGFYASLNYTEAEWNDWDEEGEDEDEGDDMCDICMRSNVQVGQTTADGRTVCGDCAEDWQDEWDEEGEDDN